MTRDLLLQYVERAVAGDTDLDPRVLDIVVGFATPAKRHLLHLICNEPGTRYLEVGTWEGASFIPAALGHGTTSSVGIDNFSEHGPVAGEHFVRNVKWFLDGHDVQIVMQNCWHVPLGQWAEKKFTVYCFDGPHSREDHERAFVYYDSVLADSFIAVVDDWLWPDVEAGTRAAFARLGYRIEWEWESGPMPADHPRPWATGFYVAKVNHN